MFRLFLIYLVVVASAAGFPSRVAADTAAWPFSAPGEYVLSDSTKIEIAGGVTRLIAVDQTDADSTAMGFGGGAHNQTQWSGIDRCLELTSSATSGQFTSRVLDAGAAVHDATEAPGVLTLQPVGTLLLVSGVAAAAATPVPAP